ncbi:MAG TPA: hypothetical protein PKK13_10665, partial [Spirochaetota bacterium]|nr:hypothetical protein [Spirochaetota bacterium]
MITNKYLFSSQFISYLKKQKVSAVDTYEGFSKSIKSLIETKKQIENSDIINILSQLQFACSSMERDASNKSAHFCYLYDGFPLKKKVSCLYFINDDLLIDKNSKGSYPVFSLIYLMKKENLEWGILTTGKKWRLYSVLTAQPYENYIEIDFNNYEEEDIKLFWQLFSLTLFLPDENSVTPLEKFIEESEKEAKVIEDHIKNNIDIILENICWGFLTYSGKENIPLDDEEKQKYFDNAVYLLFRLLFVLYAESRALLPMSAPEYQKKSLNNLIVKAKDYTHNGITEPDKTELWDRFRDLCIDIDGGNERLGIPEYDGGLFDSREHSFLSDKNNKLKDGYFYKILYNLGFMIKSKNEIYIDYKDLSVRSLGSLYEGILEYKLFIADEEMVIRKSDNKTVIKPAREAGAIKKSDRVIDKGNVYFSQDAFERHDTGAYYTPEDVVNYMVSNSVRLGLEERWIQFHDTVKKYEKELITAINDDIKNGLLKKFDRELLNFIEEKILTFKIIDPAMGSGHFLVNSLNTVTHFIIEVLQNRVIISSGPIKHEILPVDIDWNLFAHINESIYCDPVYWRRKVSEKCIFGIDINFLAVELAKLSIWIATASEGKPLTFLNHHLKCGDSIMGVRISDIQEYPKTAKEKTEKDFTDIANETAIKVIKEQFIRMLADDSDVINQVDSKKDKY